MKMNDTLLKMSRHRLELIITTLLVVVSLCFYTFNLEINVFDVVTVNTYVWAVLLLLVVFTLVARGVSTKYGIEIPVYVYFVILFLLYSFRNLDDISSQYLWAEDGYVLIHDSVTSGVSSLFNIPHGSFWLIPRLISLISYSFCFPFSDISLLPLIQGVISKIVSVGAIAFFLSDRFSWIVNTRIQRFLVCVGVIISMPYYAIDVFTCDTSVPFVLNIAVFLIGLDVVCSPCVRPLSIMQILFLSLMALSTAASPFVSLVACLAFFRWLMFNKRNHGVHISSLLFELVKLLLVLESFIGQMIVIMISSRVGGNLDLFRRIIVCIKEYVFFPYASFARNWGLFIVFLGGWISLLWLARVPKRTVIYSSLFNYLFMLYSSFALSYEDMLIPLFGSYRGGGRYIFLSCVIAGFITAIALNNLIKKDNVCRGLSTVIVLIVVFVFVQTYETETMGFDSVHSYTDNIAVFDGFGDDELLIPVGPLHPSRAWLISIPCSISHVNDESENSEIIGHIISINGAPASNYNSTNQGVMIPIVGECSLVGSASLQYVFVKLDNNTFQATYMIQQDETRTEYEFYLYEEYLEDGNLTLVGITSEGSSVSWIESFA